MSMLPAINKSNRDSWQTWKKNIRENGAIEVYNRFKFTICGGLKKDFKDCMSEKKSKITQYFYCEPIKRKMN